mmetsp:Transcript_52111/g.125828  ORF Transcript_52111/g.125828 Transcript_52111/m.125828 type:complete len:500 (+) Transcript_52111:33-1532(+)
MTTTTTTTALRMPYSTRLSLLSLLVLQLSSSSSCVVSLASVASSATPTAPTTAVGGTATTLMEEDATKKNVHVPVGKDGEGEYTASTKGCFDVINTARPLILEQILKQQQQQQQQQQSENPTTSSSTTATAYHIADYGTADGGTSLGLIHDMVQTLRRRGEEEEEETLGGRNNDIRSTSSSEREVVIHYEDQVTNEWQSVFRHALGHKDVFDAYGTKIPTPYDLPKVFVEACGVGFHSQCYPSSSIDFGVSFTAMHWLSRPDVVSLKGTPFMHPAQVSDAGGIIDDNNNDPDESCRSTLPESIQGSKDWISILEARKAELKQGGRFVCVNFCVSKQGHYLGNTGVGSNMWDSFKQSWEQLYDEGLIDDDERYGVSFPSYYRTMDDFMKGIEEVGGFKIVSAEEKIVPCPYRTLYTETDKKNKMTPREYAEWFVPTTKSWSHSTFKAALDSPSTTKNKRTDDEKEMIVNKFWDNYMSLVEKDPSSHGMDYVHAYLVLEKM